MVTMSSNMSIFSLPIQSYLCFTLTDFKNSKSILLLIRQAVGLIGCHKGNLKIEKSCGIATVTLMLKVSFLMFYYSTFCHKVMSLNIVIVALQCIYLGLN